MELTGAFLLENSAAVWTPVPDFLRVLRQKSECLFRIGFFEEF